jgi:hypothetical protein
MPLNVWQTSILKTILTEQNNLYIPFVNRPRRNKFLWGLFIYLQSEPKFPKIRKAEKLQNN